MAVLLLCWPSPPLLVNLPGSCHIPHAFDSVLGDAASPPHPPPQPWHTYGCAVLEELHYLSNFSGLQLQSHGVTSVKGSEKNKKTCQESDGQENENEVVRSRLLQTVMLIAYHFHLLPVAPFAQQKVKLIHTNYFIVPQFLE